MTPTIPALPSLKKQGGGGVGNHPNLLLPWPSSGMEAAGTTKAGTKRQESHPWLLFDVEIPLECDGIWWELSVCSLCKGWGQLFPSVFREQSPEGPTHPPGSRVLRGNTGICPPPRQRESGKRGRNMCFGGGEPPIPVTGREGREFPALCVVFNREWCEGPRGTRGAKEGTRKGQERCRDAPGFPIIRGAGGGRCVLTFGNSACFATFFFGGGRGGGFSAF